MLFVPSFDAFNERLNWSRVLCWFYMKRHGSKRSYTKRWNKTVKHSTRNIGKMCWWNISLRLARDFFLALVWRKHFYFVGQSFMIVCPTFTPEVQKKNYSRIIKVWLITWYLVSDTVITVLALRSMAHFINFSVYFFPKRSFLPNSSHNSNSWFANTLLSNDTAILSECGESKCFKNIS